MLESRPEDVLVNAVETVETVGNVETVEAVKTAETEDLKKYRLVTHSPTQ